MKLYKQVTSLPTTGSEKLRRVTAAISSATSAPFFTLQYYDVAEDSWTTKTANATLLNAALGTDISFTNFEELTPFYSGPCGNPTASLFYPSTPSASVFDPTNTGSAYWPTDKFTNFQCRIVSGSGIGQRRRIIAMSSSSFQVIPNFYPMIDSSSVYSIYGDTDKITATPGTYAGMLHYQVENDAWCPGEISYFGVTKNMSFQ